VEAIITLAYTGGFCSANGLAATAALDPNDRASP
jgi:hypothetical protein